jgi:hypothetical protein
MMDRSTNAGRDAAHDDDVVVERVGEELLVYDPRTDEAHQLTPRAATAFEESTASGLSRRDALRRVALVGAGAAAAAPLVKSIVAPTPAQAGTTPCFPDGTGCSIDAQCCSNNCNGGVCGPPL